MLAAAAAGAGRIFVSEPQASRRAAAERNGATAVFDPGSTDVAAELLERTGGLGADCAIECSGSQGGLDACVASVRRAATVAVIAPAPGRPDDCA
jgi:(R,R)-butanediol dehydrogenase/meso-butanediol dehydrogenase/diacetyl reductase